MEFEESAHLGGGSDTTYWNFDVSKNAVLQALVASMIYVSHINEENNEQASLQDNSWANHSTLVQKKLIYIGNNQFCLQIGWNCPDERSQDFRYSQICQISYDLLFWHTSPII